MNQVNFYFIFPEYFRFHISSSSKERSRSPRQKRSFHNKWLWKVFLDPCWYSTSFKRQQDSSAFSRWLWEYPIVERRNIWWNRGTLVFTSFRFRQIELPVLERPVLKLQIMLFQKISIPSPRKVFWFDAPSPSEWPSLGWIWLGHFLEQLPHNLALCSNFYSWQVKENENDSLILLNSLSNPPSEVSPSHHIVSTMAEVQGPWAFVYWQVHVHVHVEYTVVLLIL